MQLEIQKRLLEDQKALVLLKAEEEKQKQERAAASAMQERANTQKAESERLEKSRAEYWLKAKTDENITVRFAQAYAFIDWDKYLNDTFNKVAIPPPALVLTDVTGCDAPAARNLLLKVTSASQKYEDAILGFIVKTSCQHIVYAELEKAGATLNLMSCYVNV